jgi:hypothetical protein
MPRRGHAWFEAHPDDPVLSQMRRRRRRLQDQLHEAERQQRQAWRDRRTPASGQSRQHLRNAAMVQLTVNESAEAARR